jgi:hypothetical protein
VTRAESAAVRALIQRQPALATKTFMSLVGAQMAVPYVVIHPGADYDNQDNLAGPYVHRRPSFTVHSVGTSAEQAQLVAEWVDAQLRPNGRGVKPDVAGRRTGQIMRDSTLPAQLDTDTSPPLVYMVSEYAFKSSPA